MSRFSHWGLVTLLVSLVLLLTACGGQGTIEPRPLTADAVEALSCTDAASVQTIVNEANRAPEDSGKRNSLNDWIPADRTVAEVQSDLDARVTTCASEASSSSSPAASPSAAESTAASTSSMVPADYIGWDQIVKVDDGLIAGRRGEQAKRGPKLQQGEVIAVDRSVGRPSRGQIG